MTLPQGLKAPWLLLPLLCTRYTGYLPRGGYSSRIVVEEEKRGRSTSMHASHPWAVPGPLNLSCLLQREAWPTACGRHPGDDQHPPLSRLIPWERTHTVGGFSWRYFSVDVTLPKPVEQTRSPVASHAQIADNLANTVVFLPRALRSRTHTRLGCSRYYSAILTQQGKSGKTREARAQAGDASPRIEIPWLAAG